MINKFIENVIPGDIAFSFNCSCAIIISNLSKDKDYNMITLFINNKIQHNTLLKISKMPILSV